MSSDRLHVTRREDGTWNVLRENAERVSSVHDTQAAAISRAREQAMQEQGQVIVHRENGRFREERTYRKDPYPPKG